MKRLLLSVLLFVFCYTHTTAQNIRTADDVLAQACKEASISERNVFVLFHASWCVWCHRMDNSMNDSACKKYFDQNFIVCHLVVDETAALKDQETPGAAEFRKKYKGEGQGIPYWLIFDKDQKLLADSRMLKPGDLPGQEQNIGCPATAPEVDFFINVLQKTTRMGESELSVIRTRFRQNER